MSKEITAALVTVLFVGGCIGFVGGAAWDNHYNGKAHEAVQHEQNSKAEPSDRVTPGAKKVSAPPKRKQCTVNRVIDGDTVKLNCEYPEGNRLVTVRMIGIDAPEMKDSKTGQPQCYAQKAKEEAERLLPVGSRADIWQDVTQAPADHYGRVLAYVSFRADDPYYGFRGTVNDLGEDLISGGYAKEYTYGAPYVKQGTYKQAEAEAENGSYGMWGACTW